MNMEKLSNYSCLLVTFIYFALAGITDIYSVTYFSDELKGVASVNLKLIYPILMFLLVIQVGIGFIFVGITVDPKTGKNR